jgi:chromate transporter
MALTPLGVAATLALSGGLGLALFHSRKLGIVVILAVAALAALAHLVTWDPAGAGTRSTGLADIASFFLMVGAFTFGGGLSLIAFIQAQVVNHYQWLTQEEFVAGLALGQFTPGPIIMVAAYVGYKMAGVAGAAVATASIFLPSFVLMLSILPFFEKVSALQWTKAAMKGIGPAVIGLLGLSLLQMGAHVLPDLPAVLLFVATAAAIFAWQVGIFKLLLGGAALGILWAAVAG